MTAPNAELAYQVLDVINAHPENFDMASWTNSADPVGLTELTAEVSDEGVCGTTGCFAGWAIALSGFRVSMSGDVFTADGERINGVERFAAELLRIDDDEVDDLFFVEEAQINDAVAEIFGPRPGGAA